jgi:F0F1-type ATP synthase alpha subunit
MESHFERILEERSLRMEERLATVQGKMEELTLRFEEEKDRVPREMEARGKELLEMMESFKAELAQERTDRLSREGRILKQMDDHAKYITESIEKESVLRESTSKELMDRISENEKYRAQSEYELQAKVQREMTELREMIEKEKHERAGGDKLLNQMITQYTQQVERTLYSLTE